VYHRRLLFGAVVGLLAAFNAACSGGGQATAPTTTVADTSTSAASTSTTLTPTSTTAMPTSTTVTTTSTTPVDQGRPFPSELLPEGCAAETVHDPALFEAVVAARPTFAELCAAVGPPDGTVGSGLFIVAYDLADGSQVWVTYGSPFGTDPLMGATLKGPDGQGRPWGG